MNTETESMPESMGAPGPMSAPSGRGGIVVVLTLLIVGLIGVGWFVSRSNETAPVFDESAEGSSDTADGSDDSADGSSDSADGRSDSADGRDDSAEGSSDTADGSSDPAADAPAAAEGVSEDPAEGSSDTADEDAGDNGPVEQAINQDLQCADDETLVDGRCVEFSLDGVTFATVVPSSTPTAVPAAAPTVAPAAPRPPAAAATAVPPTATPLPPEPETTTADDAGALTTPPTSTPPAQAPVEPPADDNPTGAVDNGDSGSTSGSDASEPGSDSGSTQPVPVDPGDIQCVRAPCCYIGPGAADEPVMWCDGAICDPTDPAPGCPIPVEPVDPTDPIACPAIYPPPPGCGADEPCLTVLGPPPGCGDVEPCPTGVLIDPARPLPPECTDPGIICPEPGPTVLPPPECAPGTIVCPPGMIVVETYPPQCVPDEPINCVLGAPVGSDLPGECDPDIPVECPPGTNTGLNGECFPVDPDDCPPPPPDTYGCFEVCPGGPTLCVDPAPVCPDPPASTDPALTPMPCEATCLAITPECGWDMCPPQADGTEPCIPEPIVTPEPIVDPIPDPIEPDVPPFNPGDYIGLTQDAATAVAQSNGFSVRVARIDDEWFALTMDWWPNRLNFSIDNGIVTGVTQG